MALDEEVGHIRQKQLNSPWPKLLKSMTIEGLRGWANQEVRLKWPVVAIAGENGTGKSTILKAAACAYAKAPTQAEAFFPSDFFPDTPWEQIIGAKLTFKIVEGGEDRTVVLSRVTERWNFSPKTPSKRPKRHVVFLDISRTVPVEGTVGYARIAQRNVRETGATELSDEMRTQYSSILGRNYEHARLAKTDMDAGRPIAVVTLQGREYSQFHQGAGEDATFDLMIALGTIPDTSLLLIDEVEASLHPRSQRRLVKFLLKLARVKQLQIIMTTHSPHVLEELPPEARVFLTRGPGGLDLIYGATPEYALTRMDDVVSPELYLCAEDRQAAELTNHLLRFGQLDMSRTKCIEVGPANVVRTVGALGAHNRLPFRALGVLDGDQDVSPGCVKLPGAFAPERQVFTDILNGQVPALAQRLEITEPGVRLAMQNAMTLPDHHLWLNQMATELNSTGSYIWSSACQVWVRHCLSADLLNQFVDAVRARLPTQLTAEVMQA